MASDALRIVSVDDNSEFGLVCECQHHVEHEIACRHMLCVWREMGVTNTDKAIGHKWRTSTYLNAFEKISVLMPSPAMVFAEKDQTDFPNLILMPDIVKQRGRPRKLRIKSRVEQWRKRARILEGRDPKIHTRHCRLCWKTNHAYRTCPQRAKHFKILIVELALM